MPGTTHQPTGYDDHLGGDPYGFAEAHDLLRTTLSVAALSGATSITVADTTDFEDRGELILVHPSDEGVTPEVITYDSKDATHFLSTSPLAFNWGIGTYVQVGPTARSHNDLAASIVAMQHRMKLVAPVTPAQITANQNNYTPTGLADTNLLRIESDAARSLTGLGTGEADRKLVVVNIGAFPITFEAEDAGSTAANRFGNEIVLGADTAALLVYDTESDRWWGTGGNAPDHSHADLPLHDHADDTEGGALSGALVDTFLEFDDAAAPGTPASAGNQALWSQTPGSTNVRPYWRSKASDGYERALDRAHYVVIFNNTGSTIAALRAVTLNNISVEDGHGFFVPVLTDPASHTHVDAVTVESIANNSFGWAVTVGLLEGVPTNTIGIGPTYVSAATPGLLTNSPPASGRVLVVGYTLYSDVNHGKLLINPNFTEAVAVHRHLGQSSGGDDLKVALFEVTDNFHFSNDQFVPTITANQNNFNPTGLGDHNLLSLASDAARTITGLAAQDAYRLLGLFNRGSFPITFAAESASSTDVNRFATDFVLQPAEMILIWYDPASDSRWRFVGHSRTHDHSFASDGTSLSPAVLTPVNTRLQGTLALQKVFTSGALGSDQNNYTPIADWHLYNYVRLTSSTAINLTGIVPTYDGEIKVFHNFGANNITLVDESGSSSAANRLALSRNIILAPDECAILMYDGTTARWRCIGTSSAATILLSLLINAGTEMGAAIADADEFVAYDASATANRKVTATRLPTYVFSKFNGQLVFPATQNASVNANTLDDYERGSWTPSVGGTATYASQSATYTKIGDRVTIDLGLVITLIGTGSTSAITGLPFIIGIHGSYFGVAFWANLALNVVYIAGFLGAGSTGITLVGTTAAATGITVPIAVLKNDANIYGVGSYRV